MEELLVLIALAVAPCIAVGLFVYWRDKYDKEPLNLLVRSFFGGIASVVPAFIASVLLSNIILPPGDSSTYAIFDHILNAFICVALAEELSKYLFVRYLAYTDSHFSEPLDGIVYSVMISMGFAMVENLFYVLRVNEIAYSVALQRLYTAIPAHAVFGVIMGYYAGLSKFKKHHTPLLTTGVVLAILSHGFYDFFVFINNLELLLVAGFASLLWALLLIGKAWRIHKEQLSIVAMHKPDSEETTLKDLLP